MRRDTVRHLVAGLGILFVASMAGQAAENSPVVPAPATAPPGTPETPPAGTVDASEVVTITLSATDGGPLAARHVDLARDLDLRGQLPQAISEYSAAIEIAPDFALFYAMRANAYFRNKQLQESRQDFEKALSLEPDNSIAQGSLGVVEMESGHPRAAIELIRRSLEKEDASSLRRVLINAYLKVNEYDNALLEIERYLRQNPTETGVYALRINALAKAGRTAEIVAVAHELVAIKGGSTEGYVMASTYCYLAGQDDCATVIANEGLAIASSATLYFQRGLAEKDSVRQRADLQHALSLSPNDVLVLAALAEVNLKLKDYRAANLALDQIEGRPGYTPPAEFYRVRGDVMTGLRKKAAASSAYATARTRTKDGKQLNNMCWSKATVKSAAKALLQEALKDCDAALALQPECSKCHDSRGFVLLRLKRFKEASASYSAAVSGDPAEAMSLYGRGIARLRTKQKTEGKADIAAATAMSADVAEKFREFGISR